MSLHVFEPPPDTLRAGKTYLGLLKSGDGFPTRGDLAASSHDELWLAAPHPVFNIRVSDIDLADGVERARMTGWRFFVVSRGSAVATLEFAASRRHDPGRFARLTDGRMAASSARAIGRAEASALTRGRSYALGMLRVPALGVSALWLRDRDANSRHDLFALVGAVPAQMPAERWLASDAFMRGLHAVAQRCSASAMGGADAPRSLDRPV